jgi:hypothetical protein
MCVHTRTVHPPSTYTVNSHTPQTPQTKRKQEVERAKKSQKEDFPQGIPECGTDALRYTYSI